MALTGLKIQKLLPKTNCKECGSNTCLAFAMKLAAKKADLSLCPYASEEAKKVLGAASEPPVKCIELGPKKSLKLGEETVLYRHEKKFVNQTAFAINVNDTDPLESIDQVLNTIHDYVLVRVGENLTIDMVCITQKSNDINTFITVVKKAIEITNLPLVLRSSDTQALMKASEATKGSQCVLCTATSENIDILKATAIENNHSLVVSAPNLDNLASLTSQLKEKGFTNILLQFQTFSLPEKFQTNSITRTTALKQNFKPFGYPSIYFLESQDPFESTIEATNEILKYGGICVFPNIDKAQLTTLMTIRQNIYTDPQKPIQVEPKVYSVGEPDKNSPVFITTNFSLTFFIISQEIENSGISAWLIVPECEGMSVLTAWAAGKFNGSTIAEFIKKQTDLEEKVSTREIIIPGYVSQISGEIEEELAGWKVLVGPQEAGDIESFVKMKIH